MTEAILGRSIVGGLAVFGMPLAFATLLAWRYPDRPVAPAPHKGSADADGSEGSRPAAALADNVENLAAYRRRKNALASDPGRPAAAWPSRRGGRPLTTSSNTPRCADAWPRPASVPARR